MTAPTARRTSTWRDALDAVRRDGLRTDLGPWIERLRGSLPWRFAVLVVTEVRRDDLVRRSAALAFISIVSLVPVLAALSLAAGPSADESSALFTLLSWLLPYSEEIVVTQLRQFVDQARAIRGVGIVAFLLTSLAAFFTVDRTINRIFKVGTHRPFSARLRSFTQVLFWTPVMIAATSSSLYVLAQRTASSTLGSELLALVPVAVGFLGLTMLYWLVPFTEVRFRHAALGGLLAAVLLECLRHGFAIYIDQYNLTRIYGSFGLVILFLVSVQLGWLMVLLGCEMAYCLQHQRQLLRETSPARSTNAGWMAVAALMVIFDRFRRGEPIVPRELLAEQLHLDLGAIDPVLSPLIEQRLLAPSTDGSGYLLATDPHDTTVETVLACYDRVTDRSTLGMPDGLRARLLALHAEVIDSRAARLDQLTLASITLETDPSETDSSETGTPDEGIDADPAAD